MQAVQVVEELEAEAAAVELADFVKVKHHLIHILRHLLQHQVIYQFLLHRVHIQ